LGTGHGEPPFGVVREWERAVPCCAPRAALSTLIFTSGAVLREPPESLVDRSRSGRMTGGDLRAPVLLAERLFALRLELRLLLRLPRGCAQTHRFPERRRCAEQPRRLGVIAARDREPDDAVQALDDARPVAELAARLQ